MLENSLYLLGKKLLATYVYFAFKLDLKFQASLPSGPKIFVANHPSTTDPFLAVVLINEPVSILIKGIVFRTFLLGKYLKKTNQIPVEESEGFLAFDRAKKILVSGKSIVVFIEGAISSQGSYLRPKTGAVRLALATKVPIIPLGFGLSENKIWRIKTKIKGQTETAYWYTHGPYAVTFGKAISLKGDLEDRENIRQLSQKVMTEVIKLTQQSQKRLLNLRPNFSLRYLPLRVFYQGLFMLLGCSKL